MFSSLRVKRILSQTVSDCLFPRISVSMHIWYCTWGDYWHIENSLRTALAGGLYTRGTRILESEIDKHYVP